LAAGGGERIVFIHHVIGIGQQLFEAVRQIGAVGIASKRAGSPYRGGPTRDWLKAKVSETGALVITGYIEARGGRPAERWPREPCSCYPGAPRDGRRGQVLGALPQRLAARRRIAVGRLSVRLHLCRTHRRPKSTALAMILPRDSDA
jgi:hypothetical protein